MADVDVVVKDKIRIAQGEAIQILRDRIESSTEDLAKRGFLNSGLRMTAVREAGESAMLHFVTAALSALSKHFDDRQANPTAPEALDIQKMLLKTLASMETSIGRRLEETAKEIDHQTPSNSPWEPLALKDDLKRRIRVAMADLVETRPQGTTVVVNVINAMDFGDVLSRLEARIEARDDISLEERKTLVNKIKGLKDNKYLQGLLRQILIEAAKAAMKGHLNGP